MTRSEREYIKRLELAIEALTEIVDRFSNIPTPICKCKGGGGRLGSSAV